MRSPAQAGHGTRAADGTAEQVRQLFERGESFRAADAAAASDDHARLRQRDLSGVGLDLRDESHAEIFVVEHRRKDTSRDLGTAGRCFRRQSMRRERQSFTFTG